jgi:hypothetical protein
LIFIRHRSLADFTPRYSRHLYPKMLNGARKNLSNLVLNFVTYLWNTTLEAISEMQITFEDKARADPPSLKKLWRDRRKSAAYTRVCENFEEVSSTVIGR